MTEQQEIKGSILHRGPWQVPYKAINVLCSDGKRRTARTAIEASSYWTLDASMQVKGKTVSGFLSVQSDGDIWFYAYQHKKNGHLLP